MSEPTRDSRTEKHIRGETVFNRVPKEKRCLNASNAFVSLPLFASRPPVWERPAGAGSGVSPTEGCDGNQLGTKAYERFPRHMNTVYVPHPCRGSGPYETV